MPTLPTSGRPRGRGPAPVSRPGSLRAGADLERLVRLVDEAGAALRRPAAVDDRGDEHVHALLERDRLRRAFLVLARRPSADVALDLLAVEPPRGAVIR